MPAALYFGALASMGLGRGAFEDEVRQVVLGQEPVHALGGGGDAEPGCAGEAVGGRVDADHVLDLDVLAAAHQLEHQVGADVAGADDRGGFLCHGGFLD